MSFQQQRLGTLAGVRHQAMVSHDQARARVPAKQRIVIARRPNRRGAFVPAHRLAQPLVGAWSAVRYSATPSRLRPPLPDDSREVCTVIVVAEYRTAEHAPTSGCA